MRYQGVGAYSVLVPFLSVVLVTVTVVRWRQTLAGGLGRADWLVAAPLLLTGLFLLVWGVVDRGNLAPALRLDLLAFPFLLSGGLVLVLGVRLLVVGKFGLAYAFFTWPVILAAVEESLTGVSVRGTGAVVSVTTALTGIATRVDAPGDPVFRVSSPNGLFEVAIASACSGLGSISGAALIATAATVLMSGRWTRKVAWVLLCAVLAWLGNIIRVLAILAVGHFWGRDWALGPVHAVAGVVVINLVLVLMISVRGYLGLGWTSVARRPQVLAGAVDHPLQLPARGAPKRRQVVLRFVAMAGVIGAALSVDLHQATLHRHVDNSAAIAPSGASVATVTVDGFSASFLSQQDWSRAYFGDRSSWNRFRWLPTSPSGFEYSAWVDAIETPDYQALVAHSVEQCYNLHGATVLYRTRTPVSGVNVTVQAVRLRDGSTWHMVFWEWPILRDGKVWFERTVILASSVAVDVPETSNLSTGIGPWAVGGEPAAGVDPNPALSRQLLMDSNKLVLKRLGARAQN